MLLLVVLSIKGFDNLNFSIDSQNILFWGIIALLVQVFSFISLYQSHKKVIYNIRRVSTIGELSHPKVDKILNGMGSIGREIEILLHNQNEIVELRANRIIALNNLVSRLAFGFKSPVIITDVSGKILYFSSHLREKIEANAYKITDVIIDLPLESAINLMEGNKSIWQDEAFKGITANPIFGRDNLVSFCLWELDSEIKKINKPHDIINNKGSFNKFISRFKKKE